jgi:hypothetical protein
MTNKPMKVPGPEHPIDITPTKGRVTVEVNGIRIAGTGASDLGRPDRGGVMLAVAALAVHIEMKSACRHLALNRGFVYRDRFPASRSLPTVYHTRGHDPPVGTL